MVGHGPPGGRDRRGGPPRGRRLRQQPSESASSGDSKDPLVVGISLPLTGDFSQPGGEARKGYEIWRDQVNADGGLLGRKVELKITDDASSQDTVVTDYTKLITQDKVDLLLGTFSTLLNFPASAVAEKNGMLYVEPAGGAPKMFDRGFKKLFFAQQATAAHQPDVFVDYIKSLPADQRPEDRGLPDPGRPVHHAGDRVDAEAARGARRQDGLHHDVPGRRHQLPDDRQRDRRREARPDRPGRGVRGRRGPGPLAAAAQLLAEVPVPDLGAEQRRPVQRRHRCEEHRGRLLHGQLEREGQDAEATTSSSPSTPSATTAASPPRTRPTPTRRRRSCRRRWEGRQALDQDQAGRRGCTRTRSTPSSVRWPGTRRVLRRSSSCSRSGRAARAEIVAPKDAATVDKAVAKTPWQ